MKLRKYLPLQPQNVLGKRLIGVRRYAVLGKEVFQRTPCGGDFCYSRDFYIRLNEPPLGESLR